MTATTSNVSYPTEPQTKKPKQDLEDEDELSEASDCSDISSDEWIGDQREVSLDELDHYEVILDLCKLALTHYQNSHPGETYEFVSVQKALSRLVAGYEYSFTFCAKNLKAKGNDVETFEAVGYDLVGEELKILECVLLK